MFIGALNVQFRLHGCFSLKEKRGRVAGLRDRFGATKNIACCESGAQDDKTQAEFTFVCVGTDRRGIEGSLARIVDFCQSSVDAELICHQIEWL